MTMYVCTNDHLLFQDQLGLTSNASRFRARGVIRRGDVVLALSDCSKGNALVLSSNGLGFVWLINYERIEV